MRFSNQQHSSIWKPGKPGDEKWSFKTYNDEFRAAPLVGPDDTVYIGGKEGYLYAVKDGKEQWRFRAGGDRWGNSWRNGEIHSTAVMGEDGTIYFGSDNTKFYAVKEGEKLWEFKTRGEIQNEAVVTEDGTIYFGSFDNSVYAVKNGTKHARYESKFWVMSSPCVGPEGTVYFGSLDKNVYAVKGCHLVHKKAPAQQDDEQSSAPPPRLSCMKVSASILTASSALFTSGITSSLLHTVKHHNTCLTFIMGSMGYHIFDYQIIAKKILRFCHISPLQKPGSA